MKKAPTLSEAGASKKRRCERHMTMCDFYSTTTCSATAPKFFLMEAVCPATFKGASLAPSRQSS